MSVQGLSDVLKGKPDPAYLSKLEPALARMPAPGAEGLAVLTALRWHRLTGERNGLLRVFQDRDMVAREGQMISDLAEIGAAEAADLTRARFEALGQGWLDLPRHIGASLEASDRLLQEERAQTYALEAARAALEGAVWAFLRAHPELVSALESLPKPRGFMARLFGSG